MSGGGGGRGAGEGREVSSGCGVVVVVMVGNLQGRGFSQVSVVLSVYRDPWKRSRCVQDLSQQTSERVRHLPADTATNAPTWPFPTTLIYWGPRTQ